MDQNVLSTIENVANGFKEMVTHIEGLDIIAKDGKEVTEGGLDLALLQIKAAPLEGDVFDVAVKLEENLSTLDLENAEVVGALGLATMKAIEGKEIYLDMIPAVLDRLGELEEEIENEG